MIEQKLYEASRDLGQARDLLHDAVDRLTASFTSIVALVDGLSLEGEAAKQVHREVGAAVIALQFQDLIDQLLGHALKRLDVAQETLLTSPGAGGAAARAERDGPGSACAQPVTQRRLDPGGIELF
jgi:hypothetical protein